MHAPSYWVYVQPVPPNNPASGLSAVPSPNNRIGVAVNAPVAETLGDLSNNPPEVDTDAAAREPADPLPNSRRLHAAAVHANGPAAGTPPSPPPANQDNKPAPNPDTTPPAAADFSAGAPAAAGAGAAGVVTDDLAVTEDLADTVGASTTAAGSVRRAAESVGMEEDSASVPAAATSTGAAAGAVGAPLRRGAALRGRAESFLPRVRVSATVPLSVAALRGARLVAGAGAESAAPVSWPAARVRRCDGRVLLLDAGEDAEPSLAAPVEPAEPVVSAWATAGITTTAAPTPSATASAPTRPTRRSGRLGDRNSDARMMLILNRELTDG
ncbi:MAG: hypothetical protein ACKOQ4_09615 [Mycobacterium sp.]